MNTPTNDFRTNCITAAEARTLAARVQCQFDGRLKRFRVGIACQGLILRGHAISYYVKQLAQHAVMEESNLPILANEIEVFDPDSRRQRRRA